MADAPCQCLYCDGTDEDCGFCTLGVPLDTQQDWDRTWGRTLEGSLAPLAPPVRLCCGQRHLGPLCPDGLVMCCLCFARVAVAELATDDDHNTIDVCKPCAASERLHVPTPTIEEPDQEDEE